MQFIIFVIAVAEIWAAPQENNVITNENEVETIFEPNSLKMINGEEAIPHSFPYQVYFELSDAHGFWVCNGVLITQSFVLTSAYCINRGVVSQVYLGIHDVRVFDSSQYRGNTFYFYPHERYEEATLRYDIGVVMLREEAELNGNITLAELPSEDDPIDYEGRNATITTWGTTSWLGEPSNVLLEANVTIISNDLCNTYYYGNIKDYQMCTSGDTGVVACTGDYGGPLVLDNKVIGILSYGREDCKPGYPIVYTRVGSFLDWISEKANMTSLWEED